MRARRANGRKFPPLDGAVDDATGLNHRVFKDPNDAECPLVLFVPMRKNPEADFQLDPQACAENNAGFLDARNFAYTDDQFEDFAGLMEQNMVGARDALLEGIAFKLAQLGEDSV